MKKALLPLFLLSAFAIVPALIIITISILARR